MKDEELKDIILRIQKSRLGEPDELKIVGEEKVIGRDLKKDIGKILSLAEQYLKIAELKGMPEEREMPDFPSTQKEQSKAQWNDGFNEARRACILAVMKEKERAPLSNNEHKTKDIFCGKCGGLVAKLRPNEIIEELQIKNSMLEHKLDRVIKALPSETDITSIAMDSLWNVSLEQRQIGNEDVFNWLRENIHYVGTAIRERLEKGVNNDLP